MKRIFAVVAGIGVVYLCLLPVNSNPVKLKLTAVSVAQLPSPAIKQEPRAPDIAINLINDEASIECASQCENPEIVPDKTEIAVNAAPKVENSMRKTVAVINVEAIEEESIAAREKTTILEKTNQETEVAHHPVQIAVKETVVLKKQEEAVVVMPSEIQTQDVNIESGPAEPAAMTSQEVTPVVTPEVKEVVVERKFANPANVETETGAEGFSYFSLFEKADALKKFAQQNGYNTRYALFADMGMKSGKKRFFIMDLETFEIINRGLVAHGKGNENFVTDKKYSNEPGSNCTSLGLYKVGPSFSGEFGNAFRLYGLSSSNSNAYKRSIVLHALNNIPDEEVSMPITQTEGCPSVSPKFLKEISPILQKYQKPTLLWIFDSNADNNSVSYK